MAQTTKQPPPPDHLAERIGNEYFSEIIFHYLTSDKFNEKEEVTKRQIIQYVNEVRLLVENAVIPFPD